PSEAAGENIAFSDALASAVSVLPKLERFTIEHSPVVNGKYLSQLPQTLKTLSLINCAELESESLRSFLMTHGSHLTELDLAHNQQLDLAFLTDLAESCPRLQVFKMDLKFFNTFASSTDSEPLYDDLLLEGEVPTWPSTLQTIEMVQLRKWTSGATKIFFNSLLDAAQTLPDLRKLTIKTSIDISWKERSGFRKHFEDRFNQVFLRKSPHPNPHLGSYKAYETWKQTQHAPPVTMSGTTVAAKEDDAPAASDSDDQPILSRRGRQSKAQKQNEQRSSRRLRDRTRGSASRSGSQTNDAEDESDASQPQEQYIQGLCDIVDIRIDNIRPRENIFREEDFMDSEVSGDEEWNGSDDMGGEDYAW
ncbi:hypothetical protein LTS18_008554, partial [Coniosporium uncinatum]